MTIRPEKVSSLLKREIADFIRVEQFAGITGLVTVKDVTVFPDLKNAKVYLACVGQDIGEVIAIMQRHVYQIQGMLNRKLKMRYTPRIAFFADTSGEYAQHIGNLIKKLHNTHETD